MKLRKEIKSFSIIFRGHCTDDLALKIEESLGSFVSACLMSFYLLISLGEADVQPIGNTCLRNISLFSC